MRNEFITQQPAESFHRHKNNPMTKISNFTYEMISMKAFFFALNPVLEENLKADVMVLLLRPLKCFLLFFLVTIKHMKTSLYHITVSCFQRT